MSLQDTIEMMLSDDYKERFKAEYYQLKYRCDRLDHLVKGYDNGTLNFDLTCDIELLSLQLEHMKAYLQTLEIRAKVEGIIL